MTTNKKIQILSAADTLLDPMKRQAKLLETVDYELERQRSLGKAGKPVDTRAMLYLQKILIDNQLMMEKARRGDFISRMTNQELLTELQERQLLLPEATEELPEEHLQLDSVSESEEVGKK